MADDRPRGDDGSIKPGEPRQGRRRAKTISRKRLSRKEILQGIELADLAGYPRPGLRSECRNGPRPCPFVACRYHLYLDVNPRTGSIKLNFPDLEVWELPYSCALDIAELGGITLERAGEIMNLTRERIRQMEAAALTKLRDAGFKDDELGDAFGS